MPYCFSYYSFVVQLETRALRFPNTNHFLPLLCACRCREKRYPAKLPTASIVICFHNEEFNALLRTVSSAMHFTPHRLLEEIILVDDMSKLGKTED